MGMTPAPAYVPQELRSGPKTASPGQARARARGSLAPSYGLLYRVAQSRAEAPHEAHAAALPPPRFHGGPLPEPARPVNRQSTVEGFNEPWAALLDLGRDGLFHARPGLYYVIQGRVRVSHVGSQGEARPVLHAGPGTLLNISSVIADDFSNSLAECVQPTEIAILDPGLITAPEFVKKYPELMINLVRSLCVHMVIHTQGLADTSLRSTVAQVCRGLCEISAGSERSTPGITREELPDCRAYTAPRSPALFRLRELGIIGKFTRKELEILAPGRLSDLVDGEEPQPPATSFPSPRPFRPVTPALTPFLRKREKSTRIAAFAPSFSARARYCAG